MDTFLLFLLVGLVVMLTITYKVLEYKLSKEVLHTKDLLCERERKLTEWVEGLVKKQIDGTGKMLARLAELDARLKLLEEEVDRLKDRIMHEERFEDDFVPFPDDKRSKPSMRNPLRTYENRFDKYKDINTGLYASVKPKRIPEQKGDDQ